MNPTVEENEANERFLASFEYELEADDLEEPSVDDVDAVFDEGCYYDE